jgi:hypothetical protein
VVTHCAKLSEFELFFDVHVRVAQACEDMIEESADIAVKS